MVFYNNKNTKSTNTWKLNNALLNDNSVNEEIKKLKTLNIVKTEAQHTQTYGRTQ